MKKTSKRTSGSPKRSPRSAASRVLSAFAAVAKRRRIRWYLFGAQAVAVHGVVRTSADVDVTADVPPSELPAFLADMRKAGFILRIRDATFVAETRVLPFAHASTGWPLDVVLAGPGLEQLFLDGARPMPVGAATVPVISPEHLVATKVLAGRPKDLEDVRGILRQGTAIDAALVREVLSALEDALGQSDLVPLFDEMLRQR